MALIAVPEPISCWRSDELGGPGAVTVEIDLSHLVERATDLLTSGCSYLDLGVEDLPLGPAADAVAQLNHDVLHGQGIRIVQGFPVDDLAVAE